MRSPREIADAANRGETVNDIPDFNARAAWHCCPPRIKAELCLLAGVPDAADKFFCELTPAERSAIAARSAAVPVGLAIGLAQL